MASTHAANPSCRPIKLHSQRIQSQHEQHQGVLGERCKRHHAHMCSSIMTRPQLCRCTCV
jgi:hypothetical protein